MSAVMQQTSGKPEWPISRHMAESQNATIFTDIYQQETNISIWRRNLSLELQQFIDAYMDSGCTLQASMTVSPQNVCASINDLLDTPRQNNPLSEDVAELVAMFCYLFDLEQVGLRISTLDHSMCPRFHVDHVPCRLVTTYHGVSTQWLPEYTADRSKLGKGNQGLADEHSGVYHNASEICQLSTGDVALLKGERWEGNENAGLIHRSPAISGEERRLLLTLDFMN